MKVIWSDTAIKQVRSIASLIEADKPNSAQKWINEIFDYADSLSELPQLGRIVPEYMKTSIREIILGNYRMIYKIQKKDILIVTVQNGKKLIRINAKL